MRELIDAFDQADADDDVRVVIVTGAGERAFCAGADLGGGGDTFAKGGSDIQTEVGVPRDGGGMVSLRIFESKKPVIGAINGAAVGVGVTMTLPMDIRLASDTARFGFVFARRGIVPEACSSWFLPRFVGISTAAEWCYSGRVFPAAEALERGLVRSVHAPDELLGAAEAIAPDIADNTAPVSVALTRQMMWRMLGADHPMEAHRVDSRGSIARCERRLPRGRRELPREAPARVPGQGVRRAAGHLPRLGRTRLPLTIGTAALGVTFDTPPDGNASSRRRFLPMS